MLIFHDMRLPEVAIDALRYYGSTLAFITKDIVESYLSGHPDIFCCCGLEKPIFAPNTPKYVFDTFEKENIPFFVGKNNVNCTKFQDTAYNALVNENYLIHHQKSTDKEILKRCQNKEFIHVNQRFTRCSTVSLKDNSFLTSDKGIANTLCEKTLNCLYIQPTGIILSPLNYGLLGGCIGIFNDTALIIGDLSYHQEGDKISYFFKNLHYQIVELYKGPLFDGGGLFFF